MDRQAFINGIDAEAAKQEQALGKASAVNDARLEFAERIAPTVGPIAREYEAELAKVRIKSKVATHSHGLTFELFYADGTSTGLTMYPDHQSRKLKFTKHYPGTTTTADIGSYDDETWQSDTFEKTLQQFIKEASDAGPKFGGLRIPLQKSEI